MGLSQLFDIEYKTLIVVSCSFCGLVQMYDSRVVDSVSTGWPIADRFTNLG